MDKNFFHNCVKGKKIWNKVLMLLDEETENNFQKDPKGALRLSIFETCS